MNNQSLRRTIGFVLAGLLAVSAAACGADKPEPAAGNKADAEPQKVELIVSAAASLTNVLSDIRDGFERQNKDAKLAFNFGASGALQRQIEQGAPADLFFSASDANMKALVDKRLVDPADRRAIVRNELVVVAAKDAGAVPAGLSELAGARVKTIAVGIPESVPAGAYTKEALTGAKLWDELQPKLVQGKDVRQVLAYVETGNADAGFVYRTDALASDKVKIAFPVDPKLHSPAVYVLGIVKATKHPEQSRKLFDYMQSAEARDLFRKHGFGTGG
ncbi:molybdate ABC transporter substrate-binding protein [Paenibacillus sp. GYB003]|uniref:molybdate ABC transporter substrate-binding protein n=1 Tax=Paenibacillus sp. GYB003 TaxID=2994392 RepID=UPI002F96A973